MKPLLESWNRFMLQEASIRQVMERFDSPRFLKKCEFSQVDPQKAKEEIESTVPDSFDVQQKANYLDWRISIFMKTGVYEGPDPLTVKKYYDFKEIGMASKWLSEKNISDIDSIEDFQEIVKDAERSILNKEMRKIKGLEYLYPSPIKQDPINREGQNLIYEDENWSVYTPETKAASVALCDGPDPRPVKQGGTRARWCTGSIRRKYYEQYHTEDNPLIIFISKRDPKEKYQFSYFGTPLWRNQPEFKNAMEKDILGTDIFDELNNIVKGLGNKLPERVVAEANKY